MIQKLLRNINKKETVQNEMNASCLNCDATLAANNLYCYSCGQKNKKSTITVWTIFSELISNIFNFDNSLWQSLIGVFRPAHLTKEYVKGKRKSYLNPLRLFFVTLVVHFGVLSSIMNIDFAQNITDNNLAHTTKRELQENFAILTDSLQLQNNPQVDSLEKLLFSSNRRISDTVRIDLNIGVFDFKNYPLARKDIVQLSSDSLLNLYNITDYKKRILIGQCVRSLKDFKNAIRFAVGNMIWGIITTIIILALFMKILYIRSGRFYVEHILVLFNFHSFAFILMTIPFLLMKLNSDPNQLGAYSSFMATVVGIYGVLTLKYYYGQGWIKSFIKATMISFLYLIIIVFSIMFVILLSALIF